ncbi:methyltransferase family protein [candidate division KSB1 bacterium]
MNSENQIAPGTLTWNIVWRFLGALLICVMMFFIPAGTLSYWEAWVYLAVLFIPVLLVIVYFIKRDPGLLERRMRMKEKEEAQKLIIKLSSVFLLITFLLPGFDKRFAWSTVPPAVVIAADAVVLSAYALFAWVLKENRYASRIIEVEQQQKVVTTRPYALVRHPMYLAAVLMYIFSPLALGSFWAAIPAVLLPVLLVARIRNEESVLMRELEGYQEYSGKVRYRLIPGIW